MVKVELSFQMSCMKTLKKAVMTIEDFVLYSDDHFESHLLGNWLQQNVFHNNRIRAIMRTDGTII